MNRPCNFLLCRLCQTGRPCAEYRRWEAESAERDLDNAPVEPCDLGPPVNTRPVLAPASGGASRFFLGGELDPAKYEP